MYAGKRWYRPDQIDLGEDETVAAYTCPGCNKVQDGYYYGGLTLFGKFLTQHRGELSNLIQNEVHRAQEDNPLSKLVQVDVEGDELHLRATDSRLAENASVESSNRLIRGNSRLTKTNKSTSLAGTGTAMAFPRRTEPVPPRSPDFLFPEGGS